jgi:hypothetical protein
MTPDIDALWRELEALERRLRAPAPHDAHRGADWFDDWRARLDRVQRVRRALFLSGSVAQRLVAERLSGIDLAGVGDVLLSACKDVALVWGGSVVVGGAAGGAIGFFGFGVGAVPGAVVGAGVGTQVGAWVLGLLGLKALIEDLGAAIPDALRHYETGFKLAWGPVRRWEADQGTDRAPHELAEGHIVLMIAMLSALTAYLTRGRGDPAAKARILQEMRESPRLGPKVADWVAANEGKLVGHPALKPRQQQVTMASKPAGDAGSPMTPAALRQQRAAAASPPAQPPAPPAPRRLPSREVPCFHPFDKKKFSQMPEAEQKGYLKEMAEQLRRQQDEINSLTAAEYKAARDAFETLGRNPLADGAQAAARDSFGATIRDSIRDSLRSGGMGPAQAEQEALARSKDVMSKLAALHEPDMVAGGWAQPDPKGVGRADVNSSIGGSWTQGGRIASMDTAADEAINAGRGNDKMNVKLEPCRGKGMR